MERGKFTAALISLVPLFACVNRMTSLESLESSQTRYSIKFFFSPSGLFVSSANSYRTGKNAIRFQRSRTNIFLICFKVVFDLKYKRNDRTRHDVAIVYDAMR